MSTTVGRTTTAATMQGGETPATLLERLTAAVDDVDARRLRPKNLAYAVLNAADAQICCLYQETQRRLEFLSGVELVTKLLQEPIFRKPTNQRLTRLMTIAQRTRQDVTGQQHHALSAAAAWRALVTIPLITATNDRIGMLVVGRREQPFTAAEVTALMGVAPQIATQMQSHLHVANDIPKLSETPANIPLATPTTSIFSAISDGALAIAQDYTITAINPAFSTLTGWRSQVIGRPCFEVIRCQDEGGQILCQTEGCPLVQTDTQGRPISVATIAASRHPVAVTTVMDATQRVLLLRDRKATLAAQRQRDEFLNEVAHKLRNRLNTIHGFVELVAGGQAGEIGERQQELLSFAHTSSIELMEYIENLLYLTRADQNTIASQHDTIAAGDLLEEIERYTALESSNAKVTIICDAAPDLPLVHGDRERLRQVLLNLTNNAIKFTHQGGRVTLSAATHDGATLVIAVTDTGIGIAAEDQPHIFERDFQSERTARLGKSGGGLGLATAKAIVEQLGGTLSFKTTIDHGTTFTIRLPVPPC